MLRRRRLFATLPPCLLLAGILSCSTPPAPPAPNEAPIANAGADQTAAIGEAVVVDGSASFDPTGESLEYEWSASPNNPTVVVVTPTVSFQFIPSAAGTYTFYLSVSDGSSASSIDSVSIVVDGSLNTPPVAEAGPQRVDTGNPIILDGSASTDPDGDPLTYLWETLSAPESVEVELADPSAAQTSFIATTSGTYLIRLTVSDGQLSHSTEVSILVQLSDNAPPVANAGDDQQVQVGTQVLLDGSASTDPDGADEDLKFYWSIGKTPGPNIALSDSTVAQPSFIPPVAGEYVFGLIVEDDEGLSIQDVVTILVLDQVFVEQGGMIEIPEGVFTMGTEQGEDDEKPPHPVSMSTYWIDKFEVTVAAYQACVDDDSACLAAGDGVGCNAGKNDRQNHPINCVDWGQARSYCEWAGKRLPTEAEWEKAARGTDGRRLAWGDSAPNDTLLNFGLSRIGSTVEVGTYPSGLSFYGVHNMGGNVSEWTNDLYARRQYENQNNPDDPPQDPQGPTEGIERVGRGGNWVVSFENALTATVRIRTNPTSATGELGFRCAATNQPE